MTNDSLQTIASSIHQSRGHSMMNKYCEKRSNLRIFNNPLSLTGAREELFHSGRWQSKTLLTIDERG